MTLFCFFIIRAMVLIFMAIKNRYLNLSAVLKLATTQLKMNQNEPKRSNATHNQQHRLTTNFSLPCPQPGRF